MCQQWGEGEAPVLCVRTRVSASELVCAEAVAPASQAGTRGHAAHMLARAHARGLRRLASASFACSRGRACRNQPRPRLRTRAPLGACRRRREAADAASPGKGFFSLIFCSKTLKAHVRPPAPLLWHSHAPPPLSSVPPHQYLLYIPFLPRFAPPHPSQVHKNTHSSAASDSLRRASKTRRRRI